MRRPPLTVYFLTLAVLGLIVLMTLEALHGRVYSTYPLARGWYWGGSANLAHWLEVSLGCENCLPAETFSWPVLVTGLTWIGAVVAFWLRMSWAVRSILILAVFSLTLWIPGTILTVLILVNLWLKPTRVWFAEAHG